MTVKMKLLEVSLGLATQVFMFMDAGQYAKQLEQLGIKKEEFAERLVQILEEYNHPSTKVPRIRRFTIEITIWMMNCDEKYIRLFTGLGMEEELECVSETTSEIECFNIFSGSLGLRRHGTTIGSLVDIALELMGTS
ncbi:hypothetical protein MUK42_17730 [Musa troglodytarum]|nr:hypothetical protein MUK42_17730 [Musa troglodytarum]